MKYDITEPFCKAKIKYDNINLKYYYHTHAHTHPGDAHVEFFRNQGDPDKAAGEVPFLLLQQVLALVQGDVEHPRPRPWSGLILQGHLQLPHCVVVPKIVADGGNRAERVGGHGAVEGHDPTGRVHQVPAHQLQVSQVPQPIRGVHQLQAGLTTQVGGGGGPSVVVGDHSLRTRTTQNYTSTLASRSKKFSNILLGNTLYEGGIHKVVMKPVLLRYYS